VGPVLLVMGLLWAGPARAQEQLRKELETFAEDIKKLMDAQGQDAIDVGEFSGPPTPATSAGPGIQLLLTEALKAKKVIVKEGAKMFVKGEYLLVEDDKDKDRDRTMLRLLAVVRDKRGKTIANLQADLKGSLDIVKYTAPTGYLPPKMDGPDRNEKLKQIIDKPSVVIEGTRVLARKGSPYSVEIRVKRGKYDASVARKPFVDKGQAYVTIDKGEYYEIHIKNNSYYDAAVSVTIDGLDVFTFSDLKDAKGQPRFKNWIIPKNSQRAVKGWFRNLEENYMFEVTSFPESEAAKRLKGNAKVGTITVCFHAAWEGTNIPPDEVGARSADDLGTKLGPPIRVKSKPVKRTIGVLREFVSIRYSKKGY
jgi:hypothetical protein